MRWSLALLLVLPVMAGCLSSDDENTPLRWDPLVEVPEGAKKVQETALAHDAIRLVWDNVPIPFEETIKIPDGTTIVHADIDLGADLTPRVSLEHSDTGRRRCNIPYAEAAWFDWRQNTMRCSGAATIDPPGTEWLLEADGFGPIDSATVSLTFSNRPLEGIAGLVDASQIDPATQELQPTQYLTVESFDGTPLWTEVTLPEGEGPWPTIVAASPYNGRSQRGEEPAMWEYFTQDWAKRGYAVVNVDVRGFGMSGGCVEVWGPNEQKDQSFIVDWIAKQDWSNGNVGFYGQSYVGTTPVAASVQNPDALKAIIAVAPVNNAYDDWHFGGVRNGESIGSPMSYQRWTSTPIDLQDPLFGLESKQHRMCDATLALRANDPRALYTEYYDVRNFSKRAGDVEAAVMYTHGFQDVNVKSSMATHWFNALESPKLGLFGHWVHQHPPRADTELLMLAWMEHHVKGKDLGLDALPDMDVVTNAGTHRSGDSWPPTEAQPTRIIPQASDMMLVLDPTQQLPGSTFTIDTAMANTTNLAGGARLHLQGTLEGTENAHIAAFLYNGGDLVTFGMFNLAHRYGHDQYRPVAPMEEFTAVLPFLPTEHTISAGSTLTLELRAVRDDDWSAAEPGRPGVLRLVGGEEATHLELPSLPSDAYEVLPASAGN